MGKLLFWLAHAALLGAWVYTHNDGFAIVLGFAYTVLIPVLLIGWLGIVATDKAAGSKHGIATYFTTLLMQGAGVAVLVSQGGRYVVGAYTGVAILHWVVTFQLQENLKQA